MCIRDRYTVILLPEEDFSRFENAIKNPASKNEQFLAWLLNQGKLKVVKCPSPIKTFLLSLYGYESEIPYNIDSIAENIRASQDILLKKKFELYYTALNELVEDNKPDPKRFFEGKEKLPGEGTQWGPGYLEEEIDVAGLSLAFYNLDGQDKSNLVELGRLFRTQGRRGELADLKIGKGMPKLADIHLPEKNRHGQIADSNLIGRLRDFWRKDEREILGRLAILLDVKDFEKLSDNPNYKRILKAFWKARRDDFNVDNIDSLKRRLGEIIEKLKFIQEVESKLNENLKLRLALEDKENNIVKSLDGLGKLVGLSFKKKPPKFIHKLYLEATLNKIETPVIRLHEDIWRINENVEELEKEIRNTIRYLSGRKDILDFLSDKLSSFEDIKQELERLKMVDNDLSISDANREMEDRVRDVETIFTKLTELEEKLTKLGLK